MFGITSLRIPISEKHLMLSIYKTIVEITPPGVSQKNSSQSAYGDGVVEIETYTGRG